ncbi:MAG: hypothetical protein OYG31_02805 [Candidatus Kaiserbacteria bacterium]|nr:hypothetical protein [Candidatus Kaiserbacteria bacterium]
MVPGLVSLLSAACSSPDHSDSHLSENGNVVPSVTQVAIVRTLVTNSDPEIVTIALGNGGVMDEQIVRASASTVEETLARTGFQHFYTVEADTHGVSSVRLMPLGVGVFSDPYDFVQEAVRIRSKIRETGRSVKSIRWSVWVLLDAE